MPLSELNAALEKRSKALYDANKLLQDSEIRSEHVETFQSSMDIVSTLAMLGAGNKEANENLRAGKKEMGIGTTSPKHWWSDYVKSPSLYEQYEVDGRIYLSGELQQIGRMKAEGFGTYFDKTGIDYKDFFGMDIKPADSKPADSVNEIQPTGMTSGWNDVLETFYDAYGTNQLDIYEEKLNPLWE